MAGPSLINQQVRNLEAYVISLIMEQFYLYFAWGIPLYRPNRIKTSHKASNQCHIKAMYDDLLSLSNI